MATAHGKLPVLGSIEALIVDVQSVTSSELSLKQLAALIDDEFRTESGHMEKNNRKKELSFLKPYIWPICLFFFKWLSLICFLVVVAAILSPERTADIFNAYFSFSWSDSLASSTSYDYSSVDWYFFALQILRWSSTSFKIEGKFPITNHDVDACILGNPLFKQEVIKCSTCKKVSGFYTELKEENFNQPLVVEEQDIKFNLARFQQVLSKNQMMFNEHTVSINTNRLYIKTVEDLRANDVLEKLDGDNSFHIAGTAVSYMSSHILRKEFPRPQDYLAHTAQTYKNYFYIDGKLSPSYKVLTSLVDSNFMYIQSLGSRRLVFSPPAHCSKKCRSFSRVMREGDIVFYSSLWTVHSEPAAASEKSLSYVDNFEWIPVPESDQQNE